MIQEQFVDTLSTIGNGTVSHAMQEQAAQMVTSASRRQ